MTLNIISLATIKAHLGITASTYDSALTAIIPIVSADIRRILKRQFDVYYSCSFRSGSKNFSIGSNATYSTKYLMGAMMGPLKIGDVITAPELSADTYIESYNPLNGMYQLSSAAIGDGIYIYPTVNIAQWPTISKMVWYRYSTQSVNDANVRGVASESFGPVSVSYSESEINKQYNYPQTLINDLGKPFASVC